MNPASSDGTAHKRELRVDFLYCDKNRDGYIDYKEFCTLLHNLEADMSGAELRIGFHEIDTNHDDLIDFQEFKAWWLED